jgi:hypothetical protein
MERLLIVGFGDIARRALPALVARYDTLAVVRSVGPALPTGVRLAIGDLDRPETLAPFAGVADAVLHLAPPDEQNRDDTGGNRRHLADRQHDIRHEEGNEPEADQDDGGGNRRIAVVAIHYKEKPPSTAMTAPVVKAASSEAR